MCLRCKDFGKKCRYTPIDDEDANATILRCPTCGDMIHERQRCQVLGCAKKATVLGRCDFHHKQHQEQIAEKQKQKQPEKPKPATITDLSIYRCRKSNLWAVRWIDSGAIRHKSFSYQQIRTADKAEKLAREYYKKIKQAI